jgi:hypothetical protein
MTEKRTSPRRYILSVGQVCAAGQHTACAAVSDPYDDEYADPVWVCSCGCHSREGEFER